MKTTYSVEVAHQHVRKVRPGKGVFITATVGTFKVQTPKKGKPIKTLIYEHQIYVPFFSL